MSAYPKAPPKQSSPFNREIAALLKLSQPLDCVAYLRELEGSETAKRWSDAIRRARLRDVAPDSGAVRFAEAPIHPANSDHERRFCALLLILQGELSTKNPRDLRAWGKALFRGRQHHWRVNEEGELTRDYVQTGHQGGLAARLGCSVREVDRYLAVAKAAGLISVWQVKGAKALEKLPAQLKGRKWAYACFRWLGELPRHVWDRLTGRVRVPAAEPLPQTAQGTHTQAAPPTDAEDVDWVALVRAGAVGRSRPPG